MRTKRFKEGEKLMAATRAQIPGAAVRWLAAVREPLEILTMAAVSPDVSDAQFVELVEAFSESLPGLMETMDHAALAELMEEAMGAAMANGLTARNPKPETLNPKEEKRAKLPWESEAYLAAQKRRKNGQIGEGDGSPGGGESDAGDGIPDESVSPTGRTVEIGKHLRSKAAKWEGEAPARMRFAAKVGETVSAPDEVFEDGTFVMHVKTFSRIAVVVHSRRVADDREVYQTHVPMNPKRIKKRGQKIWPR